MVITHKGREHNCLDTAGARKNGLEKNEAVSRESIKHNVLYKSLSQPCHPFDWVSNSCRQNIWFCKQLE